MTYNNYQQQQQKSTPVSTIFLYVLALLGFGLIIYGAILIFGDFGNIRGKSALTANTLYGNAQVLIDDAPLGDTPYKSNEVKVGEHKITLKNPSTTYEVSIDFEPNTEAVLIRDLGVSSVFSSGQNYWFETGGNTTVSVISEPTGGKVFIDNAEVGVTPYTTSNLTPGEYDLRVEIPNYESQVSRIAVLDKHKLNISLKLFPLPVPPTVTLLDGSSTLFDVSSSNPEVMADTAVWVKALNYWNTTRGINLSGLGVNKEPVFDFFIDYNGNVYNKDGNIIPDVSTAELPSLEKGAYLGKLSDGLGLSAQAKTAFEKLGGAVISGKKATILETGTGWLRVRANAGTTGAEVTTVDVGDEFAILEEATGWVKIQVSEGVEGWVSSTYVTISE